MGEAKQASMHNSIQSKTSHGFGSVESAFISRNSNVIESTPSQKGAQNSTSPAEAEICFSEKYSAHKDFNPKSFMSILSQDRCAERSPKDTRDVLKDSPGDDRMHPYEREWQLRLLQVQSIAASREQSLKAQRNQLQVQIELAAVREALLEVRLRSVATNSNFLDLLIYAPTSTAI